MTVDELVRRYQNDAVFHAIVYTVGTGEPTLETLKWVGRVLAAADALDFELKPRAALGDTPEQPKERS